MFDYASTTPRSVTTAPYGWAFHGLGRSYVESAQLGPQFVIEAEQQSQVLDPARLVWTEPV